MFCCCKSTWLEIAGYFYLVYLPNQLNTKHMEDFYQWVLRIIRYDDNDM